MIRAKFTDETGRRWAVEIPEGVPLSEASRGIVVGPPDTSGLGLPEAVAVRLHNELCDRELYTLRDVRRNHGSLQAALQGALSLDVGRILAAYRVD